MGSLVQRKHFFSLNWYQAKFGVISCWRVGGQLGSSKKKNFCLNWYYPKSDVISFQVGG